MSATRHAADAYIGIPFVDDGKTRAGVHCWGLLQMYYAEQLGITLPDYPLTAADRDGTAAALRDAIAAGEWLPVDTPIDGDMVTMAHQRDPCHIGMFAAGMVLHATSISGSVIAETMPHLRARGYGRVRFYRSAARGA
ncbi:MAG TPA: NlpC/P60 family protein [Solimonas sp.]